MVKKEIIWSELAKLQFKAILEYYVERNGNENYSLKLVDEVEVILDNMVKEGGLATVGQSQYELGVETGKMAADVLNGKKPATTPVKVIDYGKTMINTKKAAELGITIPDAVKKTAELVKGA